MTTVTDEQLFAAMGAGDDAAFGLLYQRYERRLFAFVLSFVRNRQDAEEVFHDALHALIAESRRVGAPPPVSVAAWLFAVGRNLSLNRCRGRRAVAPVGDDLAAADPGAEDRLIEQGRKRALARAVDGLPPRLGEVYRLRAAGHSYDDMARTLEVPLGTVKSRLNTLIKRLRKDMHQWLAK